MITDVNSEDRLVQQTLPTTWNGCSAGTACMPGTPRPLARPARWGGRPSARWYWSGMRDAINETEHHLRTAGFDPDRFVGATGFEKIEAFRDATEAIRSSDDTRRRFEILARQVFARFKALLTEPSARIFAERHDNIETCYRKLQEKRDQAHVTEVLKALHRIVNERFEPMPRGTTTPRASRWT